MARPHLRRRWLPAGAAIAMIVVAASAGHAATSDTDSVMVGPWKIEADVRNSKFVQCTMSRTTTDDVVVTMTRDSKGISLRLQSDKWHLGRNKSYPVDLVAGNLDVSADVSANGDAVSLAITDDEFMTKLAAANELDVKGAGSTIKVALDQSAAALDRLGSCYGKNSKASTDANPFVAPKHKP